MRYRIDVGPPAEVASSSEPLLIFTAVLALAAGVILVWLGWRGRQRWVVFWYGSLVVASLIYLGWETYASFIVH